MPADTMQPDRLHLVDADGVHTGVHAIIRVLRGMSRPWPLLGRVLGIVPGCISERAYDAIAANRPRAARRAVQCQLPSHEAEKRILP